MAITEWEPLREPRADVDKKTCWNTDTEAVCYPVDQSKWSEFK